MKSHQRLYGIIFLAWLLSGCSTSGSKPKDGFTPEQISRELKQEQSLASDRKQLDALRKQVPEEKKLRNDEEAQYLEWMAKVEKNPSDIRNRFYEVMRKQRETHRNKVQKLREDFSKKERQDREDFTAKTRTDREKFMKRNTRDTTAQKRFFAEEEGKRKAFFSEQNEKRKTFEAELNMQSQDIESQAREQQRAFNERIREYTERYHKAGKDKAKSKATTSTAPSSSQEFQDMDAIPATRLAPDDAE